MRNLQDIHFHEKPGMVHYIQSELNNSKNNAYDVSKFLLMAALLGDKNLYDKAYSTMTSRILSAHENLPSWVNGTNKAGVMVWLLGRMSFAEYMMNNTGYLHPTRLTAERILQSSMPKQNEFSAWGVSYLAIGLSKEYYIRQLPTMIAEAKAVTSNKEATSAEMIWVWIMVIYAAAHQRDPATYDTAWKEIKDIYEVLKPSDSQAWAFAMLHSSAQMMDDSAKIEGLQERLRVSIKNPDISQADKCLAQLTFQLAKERIRVAKADHSPLRTAYQYVRGFFSSVTGALTHTRPSNTHRN